MTPRPSTTTARSRALAVVAASAVGLVMCLLILPRSADASPQAAQQSSSSSCDQVYGCPTSSIQGSVQPSCSLSTNSAKVGATVTATITNIPVGSVVTLLFDGTQVAKETATADGQGQQALAAIRSAGHLSAGVARQDTSGGAVMSFTVPNTSVGKHTVVFSGAGFSCDATGGAGFSVLASTVTKQPGGSLSKTGIQVAMYLAVALVLIVVGLQLVRSARARRRRVARRQHRARQSVSR